MLIKKTVKAARKGQLIEITDEVRAAVKESGVNQGIVVVTSFHGDAGIISTSPSAEVAQDILYDFNRIVPGRDDFNREDLEPYACAAYSKASISGQTMDFIVSDGALFLDDSQEIYFVEYSKPCERMYSIQVIGA